MLIIGKGIRSLEIDFFSKVIYYHADPADSIDLTYTIDQVKETVSVKCEVHNIYPLPDVKLL